MVGVKMSGLPPSMCNNNNKMSTKSKSSCLAGDQGSFPRRCHKGPCIPSETAYIQKDPERSVKITPGATVCEESELQGDITIGTRTVIHPKARIIAEAGPIIIGENNIIEELCCIVNKAPENQSPGSTQAVMIIGNNNVFEVGSHIEAVKIGDHNVVEAKASVGRQVVLTSGCIIGSACSFTSNEELAENTVIFGQNCERRVQRERPPAQTLQIDFLTKILPNYHYLRRPTKSGTPQKS